MAFSKTAVQDELIEFMSSYALSIDRIYNANIHSQLSSIKCIENSWLWLSVNEMYDFGILGMPVEGLGAGKLLPGNHSDMEVFLNGIASGGMADFLYEDDVEIPWLAVKTIRTAVARHVMEGGDRGYDYGDGINELWKIEQGYLSLAEISLLADMDERSVRNAANPKNTDPLKTETVGKRSLVSIAEAKRWLAGRKGFTPTKDFNNHASSNPPSITEIKLPSDIASRLLISAQHAGMSIGDFLNKRLIEIREVSE